jgi:hypothetical protein
MGVPGDPRTQGGREIVLRLDERKARALDDLLFEVGEHLAAGAPISPRDAQRNALEGGILEALADQLGIRTPWQAQADYIELRQEREQRMSRGPWCAVRGWLIAPDGLGRLAQELASLGGWWVSVGIPWGDTKTVLKLETVDVLVRMRAAASGDRCPISGYAVGVQEAAAAAVAGVSFALEQLGVDYELQVGEPEDQYRSPCPLCRSW